MCNGRLELDKGVKFAVGFRNPSTLRTRRTSLFSLSILPYMAKQAELTEEYFSKPNTLPISVKLCPPKLRHRLQQSQLQNAQVDPEKV